MVESYHFKMIFHRQKQIEIVNSSSNSILVLSRTQFPLSSSEMLVMDAAKRNRLEAIVMNTLYQMAISLAS